MPKAGDKLILKCDADHGDWKTRAIHSERWPTLKKGMEVEFIQEWNNFYGKWWKVKYENGLAYGLYDLSPLDFQ